MGISTVQSYHGAQVFEALGLSQDFVDEYFSGTPTRIGGIGIDAIAREVRLRHDFAYPSRPVKHTTLGTGGRYQYRRDGEEHLNSPEAIHLLQTACRTGDYKVWKRFSELVNRHGKHPVRIRDLMDFRPLAKPVPLEEVEPLEKILARFKTGAMSYGSISQEAHEALADRHEPGGREEQHRRGGRGPRPLRSRLPNGDSKNSAIKQVASGRFGVTSQYLVEARELQIKMAQGAKPGEGGQLPGPKVYPWIAKVRHATPGVGLISPPPHHDIYSIEDLAQLIHDLKNANAGRAHQREARLGDGRRDDRRRGGQGARRRHPDQRLRRRDGRRAPHEHPARRHPVGDRPRRGAPDPRPQRPEEPRDARDRRPAEDRARRRHRGAPRRGGVRLRHDAAHRPRLRDDAGLPPEHLPGRRRDAGPRAAQAVHGRPRARRRTSCASSRWRCAS